MASLLRTACFLCLAGLLVGPAPAQTEGVEDGLAALDGAALAPATLRYANTVSMGSRSIDRPTTRTLASATHDGTPVWQIVDATRGGSQADTLLVDRASLRPLQRRVRGQVLVALTFDSTSVRGTLSMGTQSRSVQQRFDRPVLASTANMEVALAALPLEPGYAARFPVYQLQRQAVATTTVRVTGVDTTETPAGTFETYVLKATSDGPGPSGTIRVRRAAPHHVVQADLEVTRGDRTVTATKMLTKMETDASQTE